VFKQIEAGVHYANAGMQPYIKAQYVNINFLLILNTGAIPDACRYWQRHTLVNQTLADFRREFGRAQREQRNILSTVSGAGYHNASVAEHYVQNQIPADGFFVTAMANLTKEIVTLTDQLAAKYIWAKSKEAEMKRLLGGRVQMWSLSLLEPIVPTSLNLTRPRMTITVGHVATRLEWHT
jgi:hypothetical protein